MTAADTLYQREYSPPTVQVLTTFLNMGSLTVTVARVRKEKKIERCDPASITNETDGLVSPADTSTYGQVPWDEKES